MLDVIACGGLCYNITITLFYANPQLVQTPNAWPNGTTKAEVQSIVKTVV
jgi:hypothetical protein